MLIKRITLLAKRENRGRKGLSPPFAGLSAREPRPTDSCRQNPVLPVAKLDGDDSARLVGSVQVQVLIPASCEETEAEERERLRERLPPAIFH